MAVQVQRSQSWGALLMAGLIGGVIAAILNLVIYFIGGMAVGEMTVAMPPDMAQTPLPWFMVVIASIVPGLIAAVVLGVMRRFLPNAERTFQIVAVVLVLISLFPPLGRLATQVQRLSSLSCTLWQRQLFSGR